jgi:hypothetical protein
MRRNMKGVSHICGCTESRPCRYLEISGAPHIGQRMIRCTWTDKTETFCSRCKSRVKHSTCRGNVLLKLRCVDWAIAFVCNPLRPGRVKAEDVDRWTDVLGIFLNLKFYQLAG